MPQFAPFDYGAAVSRGQQNALAQMQGMQTMQDIQQAPEERNYLMKKRGQEEQDRQRTQAMDTIKFLNDGAKAVRDSGSQAMYSSFRKEAIRRGIVTPDQVGETYDPQKINTLIGKTDETLQEFGAFEQIPGRKEGVVGQKGPKGKYANIYDPKAKKGKGAGGMKAADANAIARMSGNVFGGMYDPVSGRFSGLKGVNAEQQVQAINERAGELFMGGMTQAGAVSKAAREAGIDIKKLGPKGKEEPAPKKKTKSVVDFLEEQRSQGG